MALPNKDYAKAILSKHFPLIGILLGSFFVSISLGPYSNWDAQTEFAAASGVITWGLPYATPGNLINQPPVGYYIDALFFRVFGLSYGTGVYVITLFGVGCVFLVYAIGKTLYGKRAGLLAAAIFGLTPWHVVLSRSFLIDNQCLFFSLLYLLVGIWAIRKGSLGLLFASGTLFGIALLTKLFAVFTLIPLALFYLYWRPKNLERALGGIVLFFLPAFLLYYSWYEIISGLGLFSVFSHNDFTSFVPGGTVPSYFFLGDYMINALGIFFLIASALSLLVSFSRRRIFAKILGFDTICLATIISITTLNMYLVLGQNLLVPYVDPVKYDYQLLPAFCWLTASLPNKVYSLRNWVGSKSRQHKIIFSSALIGLISLISSMIANMLIMQASIGKVNLPFKVEGEVAYTFERLVPIMAQHYLTILQVLGFILIITSLLWINKDKLLSHH